MTSCASSAGAGASSSRAWLLGLAAAGVVTYLTPREYSSDVTLYVSLEGRADSSDAAYQASQIAKERVVSYAPLLQDERITQPVIDRLQLPMTAAQLARHITVTVQPDTVVLSAAVTDTSPDRAAAIANALAEEFVGLVQQLEQPFGPETAAPTTAPAPAGARATTAPAPAPSPAPKIGAQIIRPATAVPVPVVSERAVQPGPRRRRSVCSSGSPAHSSATPATRRSARPRSSRP